MLVLPDKGVKLLKAVVLRTATQRLSLGDKVSFNGKTWVCDIDNNVWKPGAYGWTICPD